MPSRSSTRGAKSSFLDELLSPKGIGIILLIIIILSVSAYLLSSKTPGSKQTVQNKMTPTPTPTPSKLYPDNGVKGTYNVSAGQKNGPLITQVVFDPLNATKGQPLTLSVKMTNATPIQQVTGTLKMDNSSTDLSFTLVSKTNKEELWQATIAALPDTILYNYVFNVTALAANGKGFGGAAPRSR